MARHRRWGKTSTSTAVYRINSDDEARVQATIPYNKWLKHNKSKGYSHVVKVQCQGSTHSIRLNQRGPIELLAHKDVAGEVSMIQLGSEVPRCFAFLKAYRDLFPRVEVNGRGRVVSKQAQPLPFQVTEEVDALHNGKKGKSAAAFSAALRAHRDSEKHGGKDYLKLGLKARCYQRVTDLLSKMQKKYSPAYGTPDYEAIHYSYRSGYGKHQFNEGIRIKAFDYRFKPEGEGEKHE